MPLNDRPGLGVAFDKRELLLMSEITEPRQPMPVYRQPGGSVTNW